MLKIRLQFLVYFTIFAGFIKREKKTDKNSSIYINKKLRGCINTE